MHDHEVHCLVPCTWSALLKGGEKGIYGYLGKYFLHNFIYCASKFSVRWFGCKFSLALHEAQSPYFFMVEQLLSVPIFRKWNINILFLVCGEKKLYIIVYQFSCWNDFLNIMVYQDSFVPCIRQFFKTLVCSSWYSDGVNKTTSDCMPDSFISRLTENPARTIVISFFRRGLIYITKEILYHTKAILFYSVVFG